MRFCPVCARVRRPFHPKAAMRSLTRPAFMLAMTLLTGCWFNTSLAQAPARESTDDVDIAAIKPPPRDVKDILRVLEQGKVDLTEIEQARKILALPQPAPDADNPTWNNFHFKRALANQKLGRMSEAVAEMRIAALDRRLSDPKLEIRDLIDLSVLESFSGNMANAISALDKAKNIVRGLPQAGGFLLTINRLLVINHAAVGNFEIAKTTLTEMDNLLNRLRRAPSVAEYISIWEANVESARGTLQWQQGLWVESERSLRKALRLLNQNYQAAKNSATKADDLGSGERTYSDGTNNPRMHLSQIILRNMNLADVLLQQRRLVDAEFYAREALKLALDNFGRNSTDVGKALATMSKIVSEQGRFPEAVLLAQASLKAHTESGITDESRVMAMARKFYATALVADGQYQAADKVFNEMMAGVRKDPALEKTFRPDDLDWVLAMQKIGKQPEALAMAERMLKRSEAQSGKSSPRTALIAAFHAVSLQNQGKLKEAHAAFREAAPTLVDQTRSDAENDTASIKQQQRTTYLFENYVALLARIAQSDPAQAQAAAAEAFRVADLAKSSGVQRALTASAARANIKDPLLAQLARKEQDLQRRVNSLSELLTGLLAAPPEQQLPSVQAKIRQDITTFKAERETLKKEIERKYPDYAEMVEPKPATVERTRALLRADEVLVSWYFAEKEAYVWAISKHDIPLFKAVALGRSEMAKQVSHLRRALDPGVATIDEIPPFDVKASFLLYQQILAPVQESLKGKKVLLVVPHAELGQLPLSVLVTQDTAAAGKPAVPFASYKAVPWLVRDIAIAQLPSVTALTALRNTPPGNPNRGNFIGFGDPFFSAEQYRSAEKAQAARSTQLATRGLPLNLRNAPKTTGVSSAELGLLPRLPDTKQEILEIARVLGAAPSDVYLNRQASVKAVMEADLSNRKVVMFATHGLVPGELDGLSQPALALSSPEVTGDQDDGLLTMDKVLTLKLNADWVVLSACNTASGEGSGSEAVSGLGRAFFFAGAKALLVSNWPVDSVAARLLMTDLFRRQQTGDKALAKSDALRQAMLQLIDQGGMSDGKAMKYSYAHPLFWAPFMVVGD